MQISSTTLVSKNDWPWAGRTTTAVSAPRPVPPTAIVSRAGGSSPASVAIVAISTATLSPWPRSRRLIATTSAGW